MNVDIANSMLDNFINSLSNGTNEKESDKDYIYICYAL